MAVFLFVYRGARICINVSAVENFKMYEESERINFIVTHGLNFSKNKHILYVSLLHCYSMKMYSKRRVAKIRKALEDDQNDSESL